MSGARPEFTAFSRTVVIMKFFSRSISPAKPAHEPSAHEWAEYNLPADLALATGDDHRFDLIDAHHRLSSSDDDL